MDPTSKHSTVTQREKDIKLYHKRVPVSEIAQVINNHHETVPDTSTHFNRRNTVRRTINLAKKEKVKTIILDHIKNNPEARLSDIQAALKAHHKIAVSLSAVHLWTNEIRKSEGITTRRMLKPDDKKKVESIILDHIKKSPKTRLAKIQAALKDRLNISVNLMLLSKWVNKVRKSEGITTRSMLKPNDKKKAESIILDHIKKNPKTRPAKIQAALKDRLNISVSSMLLSKWVYKVKKSEGITTKAFQRINPDDKKKAMSIILDHIKKNPKTRLAKIQAALKDRLNISVNLMLLSKWVNKVRKSEGITTKALQRVNPDEKKAMSIILDHIKKNPKTRLAKIQAALKDRLNVSVSLTLLSKWVNKVKRSEGIPLRRELQSNEKVKALSIILDHIKKNPKAKRSDIQAALKDQHQITVSLSTLNRQIKEIRKSEGIPMPMQRKLKPDDKKKAMSIILDHIKKNPKAKLSDIQAALTDQHQITVSVSSLFRWTTETRKRLEHNTSYKVCKFCNLSHTIDQDTVEFKDNVEFASSYHLRESQDAFTAVSTSTESSHITEPLAQDIHIERGLREIKSEVKTEIKTEE